MIQNISIEPIRKELSSNGGLLYFSNLINHLNLEKRLSKISNTSKIMTLINGFITGADCLDDYDSLANEDLFSNITTPYASTTLGKFLRSISNRQLEELSSLNTDLAFELRKVQFPEANDFILTMDSTPHEQSGQKMEGVAWNYANKWCLDSLNAFDQFGFSYGFSLRPGNTYSGNGAELMIRDIFKRVPRHMKRFFRADSAYGNSGVYRELLNAGAHFTICLKENVWSSILENNQSHLNWKKSKVHFFDSNSCETASCAYFLKDLPGRNFLRVVFIRAPKGEETLFGKEYRYYAIVTSFGEHEKDNDKVILFYKGRSNAENFIKDLKMGLDFYHFPCQKLSANKMWGTVGIISYNLMRFAAFILEPKTGCFIKKTRNKMVKLACIMIKHARTITLRFNEHIAKEVIRVQEKIHSIFQVGTRRPWGFSP